MKLTILALSIGLIAMQALPAGLYNSRQFNILESSNLAKSSTQSGGVVVTGVVSSKERIYAVVAARARQANQSALISFRYDGSDLREVMLPFANAQAPALGKDGSVLLLSTDTLEPRQVVVRVDASGVPQTIGETSFYARSVWQEGDQYRVFTADGRILGQDSTGRFRQVVHDLYPKSASPSGCGSCVAPEIVRSLHGGAVVRLNRESAEMERLSLDGARVPVALSHPWIDEGMRDYDRLRASARMAIPDVPSAGRGFALIVDAAATQDGGVALLVGPHDRRRPFRVLVGAHAMQAWEPVSAPTMGMGDPFNPVFVTLISIDRLALADRLGNVRLYSPIRPEVNE
jgi:hypothetical protein